MEGHSHKTLMWLPSSHFRPGYCPHLGLGYSTCCHTPYPSSLAAPRSCCATDQARERLQVGPGSRAQGRWRGFPVPAPRGSVVAPSASPLSCQPAQPPGLTTCTSTSILEKQWEIWHWLSKICYQDNSAEWESVAKREITNLRRVLPQSLLVSPW